VITKKKKKKEGWGINTSKSFNQTCREKKRLKKAVILIVFISGLFSGVIAENTDDIYILL